MPEVSSKSRALAPPQVLVKQLDGESVLLNLETETYFGLDEVGTRMWTVLTSSPSLQQAYETLLEEYDVAPAILRRDLEALIGRLMRSGLMRIEDA